MRVLLPIFLVLATATVHGGSVDVREETVRGQAVGTVNDNFRRLDASKLDNRPGDVIPKDNAKYDLGNSNYQWDNIYGTLVVPTVDITVSTPTVVGQIVKTSACVVYVATNTTDTAGWVKIGGQ